MPLQRINDNLSFIVEDGIQNDKEVTLITCEWNKIPDPEIKHDPPEKHRLQKALKGLLVVDGVPNHSEFVIDKAKRELLAEMNKYYGLKLNATQLLGGPPKKGK